MKVIATPNARGGNILLPPTMVGIRRSLTAGIETSVGWRSYSLRGAHLPFD
jgi:hypothetical protein